MWIIGFCIALCFSRRLSDCWRHCSILIDLDGENGESERRGEINTDVFLASESFVKNV